MPISYFTPVHKPRRSVIQGVNTGTKKTNIEELDDGSIDNQISEDENEYALTSEGEQVAVLGISSTHADRNPASRPTTEFHEDEVVSVDRSTNSRQSSSKRALEITLGLIRPPLLAPQFHPSVGTRAGQNTSASGARQRHLAALTAILHRCLLQYDYVRAARAWSMILRSELDGHSVDLRYGCRWGLGAEILLQHLSQPFQTNEWTDSEFEPDSDVLESSGGNLGPERFDRLKEYYDRLSLQYPYHKTFPDAIGPLDFRSAMFGVWIYAYTSRTNLGANIHNALGESDQQTSKATTQEALRQARKMSEELVELMSSPPYSDSEAFKKLKVMVDHWAADLAHTINGTHPSYTSDVAIDRSSVEF